MQEPFVLSASVWGPSTPSLDLWKNTVQEARGISGSPVREYLQTSGMVSSLRIDSCWTVQAQQPFWRWEAASPQ